MKRAFARLVTLMALSLYIHVIPMDNWDTLSKPEKKERLGEALKVIKQELGCEHPSITLDIDEKYLYIYAECDNGKYIGSIR